MSVIYFICNFIVPSGVARRYSSFDSSFLLSSHVENNSCSRGISIISIMIENFSVFFKEFFFFIFLKLLVKSSS